MTTNYMIKNCPALDDQGRCFQGSILLGTAFKECEEKDCLIKQVIEKCKSPTKILGDFAFGQRYKADEILKLFEIEEIE